MSYWIAMGLLLPHSSPSRPIPLTHDWLLMPSLTTGKHLIFFAKRIDPMVLRLGLGP